VPDRTLDNGSLRIEVWAVRHFVIFCDESTGRAAYFSHFYGAALVDETRLDYVNTTLQAKMQALNIAAEVKYTKISEAYQNKYIELMQEFFKLIAAGDIKIIMSGGRCTARSCQ
jgi:hypothetical protein